MSRLLAIPRCFNRTSSHGPFYLNLHFNMHLNLPSKPGVTGFFVLLVLLIVASCGQVWWRALVKQADPGSLGEEPYVALTGDPAMF